MRTLVNDTADVTFKRKSDGKLILTAEAQLASISQAITEEKLKGGIGNRTLALLRSDKEITLQVRNALFDLEWLSMTQGVAVKENGSAQVYKTETDLKVTDNAGVLEVTIVGTPVENTATLVNAKGETEQAAITTQKVTVPVGFASSDDTISVTYKSAVTGNVISMDASKFSETFEVEFRTIEYDPETNKVVNDLYIQFDNAIPSGSFDLSFENGSALTPELSFEAVAPLNGSEIGRIIQVPRA